MMPERPHHRTSLAGTVKEGAMTTNTAAHATHAGHRDVRPRQCVRRAAFEPGRIDFDFTPSGTTFATAIRLSGFHAGSVIYSGEPSDPATPVVTVTGPDQSVGFSPEDFACGVYLEPPAGSGASMTISAMVDVVEINSGIRDTLTCSLHIETHASMGIDPASLPGEHAHPDAAVADETAFRRTGADNAAIEAGSNAVPLPVLSFGTGGENGNGTRNQATPAAPQNNADEHDEDLSVTWSFPDSYEYVTEVIISIPLDRNGNPVGDIVYEGPPRVC